MSFGDSDGQFAGEQGQPSEDEIRAALEEEMRRIHVGDVILQTVVTLVQLAGRRLGSTPETEPERDLDQARVAIDAVAALVPSVEAVAPSQLPSVRNAVSQLQVAWVKAGGTPPQEVAPEVAQDRPGPAAARPGEGGSGEDGPASRLWVPPGVR